MDNDKNFNIIPDLLKMFKEAGIDLQDKKGNWKESKEIVEEFFNNQLQQDIDLD